MKLHQRIQRILIACLISLSSVYGKDRTIEFSDQLPPCPAEYLTDCLLASDGSIWITSEGQGIYCLKPLEKAQAGKESWLDISYYHDLKKETNYYSIAEDKQGRIWVGTDNEGVSVFNGEKWKTYNRENALLGERIFDIAVSPVTGDVAIATSGGVNVFKPQTNQWLNLTRAEGLVEDQVETLAYDDKGNLWLGYACGGVSQLSEQQNYKIINTEQAKWYWDKENRVRQPIESFGSGLPSNLCNTILPTKKGDILLGTNSGLAFKKGTSSWKYLRGEDCRDKNQGLWNVKVDRDISSKAGVSLLPEDYVTCLAETKEGWWIGFRQKGAVLINPLNLKKNKLGIFPKNIKNPFVKSLLTLPNGSVYAATYGHGIIKIHEEKKRNQLKVAEREDFPSFPPIPSIKTRDELNQEAVKLNQVVDEENNHKVKKIPYAVAWKEDWATKGDWYGYYGKDYALLCGTCNMGNDIIANLDVKIDSNQILGFHKQKEDSLSVRPHNDNASLNPNVLFNPKTGTRIATEWSDNGEEYASKFDGPDIWTSIQVPEGYHSCSLYFYNYQGKDHNIGTWRDFIIEVRSGKLDEGEKIQMAPILARSRVKDFHGSGVYKTFILSGPETYSIRILNNYSSDAILNGLFISRMDLLKEKMNSIFNNKDVFLLNKKIPITPKGISQERSFLLSLYRHLNAIEKETEFKKILNIWTSEDHEAVQKKFLEEWYHKQDEYAIYRSQEFFPFSPRTLPLTVDECEVIEYMGLDWKSYLPNSKVKPKIELVELQEKISSMSQAELDKLKNQYQKKLIEEISKSYKNRNTKENED